MLENTGRILKSTENVCVSLPLISKVYWKVAPTAYETWFSRRDGVTEPVFEQLQIDPFKIRFYSNKPWKTSEYRFRQNIYQSFGTVWSGNWDREELHEVYPYDITDDFPHLEDVNTLNHLILPSFQCRFEKGLDWSKTPLYKYVARKINNGEHIWHDCESLSDLRERCLKMDVLYESMRSGYRSQLQLSKSNHLNKRFLRCVSDEVLVDIGRNGELLLVDGIHRLTFSRILNIDKITVSVVARHRKTLE
jgi:hypothetical protein